MLERLFDLLKIRHLEKNILNKCVTEISMSHDTGREIFLVYACSWDRQIDACKCQSTYRNMKQMENPGQNLSITSNFCETDILPQDH